MALWFNAHAGNRDLMEMFLKRVLMEFKQPSRHLSSQQQWGTEWNWSYSMIAVAVTCNFTCRSIELFTLYISHYFCSVIFSFCKYFNTPYPTVPATNNKTVGVNDGYRYFTKNWSHCCGRKPASREWKFSHHILDLTRHKFPTTEKWQFPVPNMYGIT